MAASCGSSNEKSDTTISPLAMERGLKVYKTHCFACHQMSGNGIKNLYPPLASNETVSGDKTRLIEIVLNGMKGEVLINGEKYNQVMVPHNFLSDEQVADVLTFTRNSFGNKASAVKESEVKQIRKNN